MTGAKNRGTSLPSPEALQAWEEVLQLAEEFRAAQPWLRTSGAAVLGVRDPVSGEIDWCRILGQERQYLGLGIYMGDAGYATLQRAEDQGIEEFDEQIAQRAVVLVFTRSADVLPQCKAILKKLGRVYRGANSWPELLWHEPGFMPIPPRDVAMLNRIANTLRGLLALLSWLQQQSSDGLCDDPTQAFVTAPPFGAAQIQQLDLPEVPPAVVEVPAYDRLAARRLQQSSGVANGAWFLDWFSGYGIVDGPEAAGRPYFLGHMLLLDLASNQLLVMDVAKIAEVPARLQAILLRAVPGKGCPTQLIIRRQSLVPVLESLAADLGIDLVCNADAVQITRHMAQNMMSFFGR
jgi:hypothetical protein